MLLALSTHRSNTAGVCCNTRMTFYTVIRSRNKNKLLYY